MSKRLSFILLTIVFIFVAHDLSTLIHEWIHGFVAWAYGYKGNPFDIHYGSDWIFLSEVDEDVNYEKIASGFIIALIAISPTIASALLFLAGIRILRSKFLLKRKWLYVFCFWFTLMNLGQVLCYIPIRTFSPSGDIANFVRGSGVSPWIVFVLGMIFLICGGLYFFVKELPKAFSLFSIQTSWGRNLFVFVALLILFVYFGGVGFTQPYPITHVLSGISWGLFPITFLLWIIFFRMGLCPHRN